VIITTIQRNRDLVVPNGDTVLIPGDELVLIGDAGDIAAVCACAAAHATSVSTDRNGTAGPLHRPPVPAERKATLAEMTRSTAEQGLYDWSDLPTKSPPH
jgi:hypothetical protein